MVRAPACHAGGREFKSRHSRHYFQHDKSGFPRLCLFRLGLTYLFISHDMAVVRVMAHRIGVLKSGKLVEENDAASLIDHPQQPYTQMLMDATPRFNA